ncbi:hypothetical protein [Nocardia sp. NPDC058666]|uniref:hypothetical protein n=1 Tax=unclassified Nocardia TaxID=2637762 RepID=UPI00364BA301
MSTHLCARIDARPFASGDPLLPAVWFGPRPVLTDRATRLCDELGDRVGIAAAHLLLGPVYDKRARK